MISVIASAVVGFFIGIFVYRNNVNQFSPFAEKIDDRYDDLEVIIRDRFDRMKNELKQEIKKKNSTGL